MKPNFPSVLVTLLAIAAASSVAACAQVLPIAGASNDAGSGDVHPDASEPDASEPDSGSDSGQATLDGGGTDTDGPTGEDLAPLPAQCANPGPFEDPTSVTTQIVGTWIYCDSSIFVGCNVPLNDVGIVIRADGTWQKLGYANGQLVDLTLNIDIGTWSVTSAGGPNLPPSLLFQWDGVAGGVGVAPIVSTDGRTMQTNTSAGGHTSNLAKQPGTP